MEYTVLLKYPDYVETTCVDDIYEAHVKAKSSKQAIFFAKFKAQNDSSLDIDDRENFSVLAVYEGHLINLKE